MRQGDAKGCVPTLLLTTVTMPMKREDRRGFFSSERTVGHIVGLTLRTADGRRHLVFAAAEPDLQRAASGAVRQLFAKL